MYKTYFNFLNQVFFLYFFLDKKVPKNQERKELLSESFDFSAVFANLLRRFQLFSFISLD